MHGDGELSLLILSYDLPGALGVKAGVNVFFSPPYWTWKGPAQPAQPHGPRDPCSSCSFSRGGNAAGREGCSSASATGSSPAPRSSLSYLEGGQRNCFCVQVMDASGQALVL